MSKLTRRNFIKLSSSAGIGMAALAGCSKKVEKLIPYVNPPVYPPPGEWSFYSTVCRECPAGCGMHLWHINGRVTKADGNPEHPINKGTLCARGQSSVQGLYNPDRIKTILKNNRSNKPIEVTWNDAFSEIGNIIKTSNRRVFILSNLQTGSLSEVINSFASSFGNGTVLFYEPFNYETLRSANNKIFGAGVVPEYYIGDSDYILSIGADFLETWISPVEYALGYSNMHSYKDGKIGQMTYIGPRLSMTASNSDNFIQTSPYDLPIIAFAILREIIKNHQTGFNTSQVNNYINNFLGNKTIPIQQEVIRSIASSFVNAKASVALAGSITSNSPLAEQTAIAAGLINYVSGRVNQTVNLNNAHALTNAATDDQINIFFKQISKNDILIINEANPVYSFSGSQNYIEKAGTVIYTGTMMNETANNADWFLPVNYPLESWGDYDPYPNVHGLMQPTMAPFYNTLSFGDILLSTAKEAGKPLNRSGSNQPINNFHEWVQQRWFSLKQRVAPAQAFEDFWNESLKRGVYQETVQMQGRNIQIAPDLGNLINTQQSNQLQLWVWPHIMLFDGHLADRPWLQEIPEPVSYLAWESWIDIHPDTANKLGIENEDVIELETSNGKVEAPTRITEDVNPGVFAIAFGQGHTALGRYAEGRGTNAFKLLGKIDNGSFFPNIRINKTGRTMKLVYESATQDQHGRDILTRIKLSDLQKMKPGDGEKLIIPLPEGYDPQRDLYPAHVHKNHRWAMTIDLQACIGCAACSAACYAENNIPFVGRKEVSRGRELTWLKVIPYKYEDEPKRTGWILMLCQHCDSAPCEPVCPVFAAVHNEEGLNAQIYNRCIGTRYCSNNCPYKVRRFNWLNYERITPLQVQLNPEVTVRDRGVMEKCTFCVQRIRHAEFRAKTEGRNLKDGEIITACAQTCPTRAIVFGDLLDPNSEVTKITRNDPRRHHLLEELNTKPAVTYLKEIKIDNEGNA